MPTTALPPPRDITFNGRMYYWYPGDVEWLVNQVTDKHGGSIDERLETYFRDRGLIVPVE